MSHSRITDRATTVPPLTPANGVFQVVELEAGHLLWEPAPGQVARGSAFNGQVPGPVIEATVGDTLLVRFTNRLPEPIALHWHGLRAPMASNGTDPAASVAPGGIVEYPVHLPDAGTFWYHPQHPARIRPSGLYGGIVVRDPSEPRLDGERVLVVADLGAPLVVNGTREPEMQVPAGQVERWRLINASATRCLRVSLGGRPLRILGSDGGLLPTPQPAPDVPMAPGDRYDVGVGPFDPREPVVLEALDVATGRRQRLATVLVTPTEHASRADLSGFRRLIAPLAGPDAEPSRILRPGQQSGRDSPDDLTAGRLQVWELVNDTSTAQPFELHGSYFQVLAVNGGPPPYRSWEDTITVPSRGRTRIAWLPDDRPHGWRYRFPGPR